MKRGRRARLALAFAGTLAGACGKAPERAEAPQSPGLVEEAAPAGLAKAASADSALVGDEKVGLNRARRAAAEASLNALSVEAPASALPSAPAEVLPGDAEAAPRTRSYFPETFLFEPRVVTDAVGAGRVEVRVPDRLTTWRVLALAHSRAGAQAGTEATFLGTLPVYVDPIVPARMFAEDEVRLPIQVVNTTDAPLSRTLSVEATGVARTKTFGSVRVAAFQTHVAYAVLRPERPGTINLLATLGGADAVSHEISVLPSGRPWTDRRGGTLAQPRVLDLELPKRADPSATSARLLVYPGALSVLRSELGAAPQRGGIAEDAYALLLAGRGKTLIEKLGGEPDAGALRSIRIGVGQRVIRAARVAEPLTAALLVEPTTIATDNPVLVRLGERLAAQLASAQRPDGTFLGATGWTLQRLMVVTAECARALAAPGSDGRARARAERARLLASGAFERNHERIEDAYSLAVVLSSGVVDATTAKKLRARVLAKIEVAGDGSRFLPVDPGVVRADGSPPSRLEASAYAILALQGDAAAREVVPDLGAYVLGAYDPRGGFGDGRTNLAALRAVLTLFGDPVPARVSVSLSMDDKKLAETVLEGAKLKDLAVLEAALPASAGPHRYVIKADPPVPGLGYSLTFRTFLPWEPQTSASGLEIEVQAPKSMKVGEATTLEVQAALPGGVPFSIELSLPAGVVIDRPGLEALRVSGQIERFELGDGVLSIEGRPLPPAQPFTAKLRAIPTLAGRLHSGPSTLRVGGAVQLAPPVVWAVRSTQ